MCIRIEQILFTWVNLHLLTPSNQACHEAATKMYFNEQISILQEKYTVRKVLEDADNQKKQN